MQHYEPVSFQYNTLTFKTNAFHLASNEGRIKHFCSYINGSYSLTLVFFGNTFCHLYLYDIPTFKTKALHLVSNEGQVKCLI